jgi:8-oxo-dGTP diphosphatase
MNQWTKEDLAAAADFKRRSKTWTLPLLFTDVVILTLEDARLKVLLTLRGAWPESGKWSLPGVSVRPDQDDSMTAAAMRAVKGKTDTDAPYLEQLRDFSGPQRDPRGWSSSYAYLCLMPLQALHPMAGPGVEETRLVTVEEALGMDLAFDHGRMLEEALVRVRNKVNYSSLPAHLLGAQFTLTELMTTYEIILGQSLDKSAFRKKVQEAGFVRAVEGQFKTGPNRPAQLYELDRDEGLVMFRRNLTP